MPTIPAGLVSQAEGQRRGKWTPVLIAGAKCRLCRDGRQSDHAYHDRNDREVFDDPVTRSGASSRGRSNLDAVVGPDVKPVTGRQQCLEMSQPKSSRRLLRRP